MSMKKWLKTLTPSEETLQISDVNLKTIELYTLPSEVLARLKQFDSEVLIDFFNHESFPLFLYHASPYPECLMLDPLQKKLFVSEFFYHTAIGSVLEEFKVYLSYMHLYFNDPQLDLHIDLHEKLKAFVSEQTDKLTQEEISTLQISDKKPDALNTKAFLFVQLLFSREKKRTTTLERKIIRDIIGTQYAKKLLGLDEDAYAYIEKKTDPFSRDYTKEIEVHHRLSEELESKKVYFEEYAQKIILHKNLLIWTWWTISPFVAADIAILLPLLAETKTIKKVYLDLCEDSQEILQAFIEGQAISEEAIEKEIRRIYPPILKDFQKETLPYLILLEKLKQLGIPLTCYGLEGIDLMERVPYLNQNEELQYPLDKGWKHKLFREYQSMMTNAEDRLTIFFQFMKPMFAIPEQLEDERIEKIIHTDKFTGYGPSKPENKLSMYSRHATKSQRSFVVPDIKNTSISKDTIVYFPYMDDEETPKLDDSRFNKFCNYDSMIYSSYHGGGGEREQEVETPSQSFFQPTF